MAIEQRLVLAWFLLIFSGLVMVACSDDDADESDQADAAADVIEDNGNDTATADTEEDIITIGEVGTPDQGPGCDPRILAMAWPWNDAVSTGSVTVDEDAGVFSATIDASAGGMNQSRNNPFVYVDLETATRVDITDLEALENTGWDLAFKRVLIRTNSADSGPGQISLARIADTSFDEVSAAPTAPSAYATDVSLDEDCEVIIDPIGNPLAAINYVNRDNPTGSSSWYNYDGGVSANPGDIYIIRNEAENTTYKLEIRSWSSGVFDLRWAEL